MLEIYYIIQKDNDMLWIRVGVIKAKYLWYECIFKKTTEKQKIKLKGKLRVINIYILFKDLELNELMEDEMNINGERWRSRTEACDTVVLRSLKKEPAAFGRNVHWLGRETRRLCCPGGKGKWCIEEEVSLISKAICCSCLPAP